MGGLMLKGIDFGRVFVASGTLNFFGEGWPYHRYYKLIPGFDFTGATFVAKTTTLAARAGNMPLNAKLQPAELFPRCIRVNFLKRVVLNAVGLSGPGAVALLEKRLWQNRTEPFFISFMAVGATKADRLKEAWLFVNLLETYLPFFEADVGLQINVSCPNTDHDPTELAREAIEYLKIASKLGIPLDLKINALTPVEAVRLIEQEKLMDSLTVSNTIPWGKQAGYSQVGFCHGHPSIKIDWPSFFGSEVSPLADLGGGGLSGAPLLRIVGEWLARARDRGITVPIITGGGILAPDDVNYLMDLGASAIAIGSVAILKPWNVKPIIERAKQIAIRRG